MNKTVVLAKDDCELLNPCFNSPIFNIHNLKNVKDDDLYIHYLRVSKCKSEMFLYIRCPVEIVLVNSVKTLGGNRLGLTLLKKYVLEDRISLNKGIELK